jgi:chorismate mutase
MDISDWRRKIDDVDRRMAALLNERASAVIEIGRLKRNSCMPIYEPDREKDVIANVQRNSAGPLRDLDLAKIYERLLDVMRSIQGHEMGADSASSGRETELDSRIED